MEQNRRHGRLPVSENVDVYSLASSLTDEDDTHGNAMGMENYREFYNDDILNALDSLKPSTGRPCCFNRRDTSWKRSSRFHIVTAT